MNIKLTKSFFLAIASTTTLLLCGLAVPACQTVDEAFDCRSICQRYADCVDSNYDVSTCASDCRDQADESEAFSDKADACEACIDERACSETFPCIDECIGVVP